LRNIVKYLKIVNEDVLIKERADVGHEVRGSHQTRQDKRFQ